MKKCPKYGRLQYALSDKIGFSDKHDLSQLSDKHDYRIWQPWLIWLKACDKHAIADKRTLIWQACLIWQEAISD